MKRHYRTLVGVATCLLGLVIPWWPLSMGGVLLLSVAGGWVTAIAMALLLDFLWLGHFYGYEMPLCSLLVLSILLIRHHVMRRMLSRMPDRL